MDFEGLLQSLINPGEEGRRRRSMTISVPPTTLSRTRPTVLAPDFELTDSNSALSKTG